MLRGRRPKVARNASREDVSSARRNFSIERRRVPREIHLGKQSSILRLIPFQERAKVFGELPPLNQEALYGGRARISRDGAVPKQLQRRLNPPRRRSGSISAWELAIDHQNIPRTNTFGSRKRPRAALVECGMKVAWKRRKNGQQDLED